ncbi:hypothetical protein EJ06DRAFT_282176 [Trichodelitschia bisporula]|uniref:Xylanolytic transcriptional activator regulatory domain-containing protein n=1 Tax=Trichodelitschia bisporula TaxID=703511 RepID=A0A6G1I5Y4_9PEZI|nr:hypothetical protein EJ06DRAFT_282176 [Trichodelitschia bisporula]
MATEEEMNALWGEPAGPPERDQLSNRLFQYLTPMMSGVDTDLDIPPPTALSALPPPGICEPLVDAFFEQIAPIYPVFDENSFRDSLQLYFAGENADDRLFNVLVKLVLCTGAAGSNDCNMQSETATLRDELFTQVIATAPLLVFRVRNIKVIQVLFLTALYWVQLKKAELAWEWCRWGIRMHRPWFVRVRPKVIVMDGAETQAAADKLTWCLYILENTLALNQYRDDLQFPDSSVPLPGEAVRSAHPVFCIRLSLTRQCNAFLNAIRDPPVDAVALAESLGRIYAGIGEWRSSVPMNYQPENEIFADSAEYQAVLLMHMEYHTLLLSLFTTLNASWRILRADKAYERHPFAPVRNQINLRITHARRLLRTVKAVSETAELKPAVGCWYVLPN